MDAGVTTAVIGLIGAVVGSSVTMVGSYLSARSDRDLALATRADAEVDARRAACAAFLTRVDSLLDRAKALVWATQEARGAPATEEINRSYLSDWAELVAANAALQLAIPRDLAKAAESLRSRAEEFGAVVDRFVGNPDAKRIPREYEPSLERVLRAREDFIISAQDHLTTAASRGAGRQG